MADTDYAFPPWQQTSPGDELNRAVAQLRSRQNQQRQQGFENARQTAQDKISAAEAARKLTAMQGYSDDITALQKQYPNGGPEFNNGVVIAGMKRFGDSPGAMSAGARSLFTMPDTVPAGSPWAPGTSGTPISAPPSASGQPAPVSTSIAPPRMATALTGVAAPWQTPPAPRPAQMPPPGAAGLLAPTPQVQGQMPVAVPAGAVPTPPPATPPVAPPGAPAAQSPQVPVSFRAIQAAQKAKEADQALALRRAALTQTGQSQTNNLNLRRDTLANTETNQASTRQFHADTLANTELNQKAQQTQRRLNLAFRNKALMASEDGKRASSYLEMAKINPKDASALIGLANKALDDMGVDKDGEAKTPDASEPATPTTKAEYDELPSGALYVDPDDGKTHRKK